MLNAKTDAALVVTPNLILEEAQAAMELFEKSLKDPDLPGVFEIAAPGIQACGDILMANEHIGMGTFETVEHVMRERHAVVVACIAMLSNYITARDLRAKKRLH